MAFLSPAPPEPMRLARLSRDDMLPTRDQARLALFIGGSIALHLLTMLGVGPLDLNARRLDGDTGRSEFHATLMPAEGARTTAAAMLDEGPAAADKDASASPAAPAAASPDAAAAGDAALAIPSPDKWYTAAEVDVRAEPLSDIRLRYPENVGAPVTGKVRVRVYIDEGGVVRKIEIASSDPPGLFDEAARQAWQDVRFSPARKNGAAVKSQKLLELTYAPGGAL
jgi:protein TonB